MAQHSITTCRLYGFIDTGYLAGRNPAELTHALIAGGVDIIQVRAKEMSHTQRVELARAVVNVAQDVPVIVNDDIAAARETGAAGVHLGQEDFAGLTRDRLKDLRIVGISTHSLAQARQAELAGADYIGVGPVFATGTKPGVPPVGVTDRKLLLGHRITLAQGGYLSGIGCLTPNGGPGPGFLAG